MLRHLYDGIILKYPKIVLVLLIFVVAFLGFQARKLQIDASAETLTLEDDEDLALTREVSERFATAEYLVITFTPEGDLLADSTLETIRRLKNELLDLEMVDSVDSILDVPLLQSPPMPVSELVNNVSTLETPGVNKELARKEFINSPIYRNYLVSPDFKTTGMSVNLKDDTIYRAFINRRNTLRDKEKAGTISEIEMAELDNLQVEFKAYRDKVRAETHENIEKVRQIMSRYSDEGELFLGGLTMIADDMVTYIKNDLKTFGSGVLILLIIVLWMIFRRLRWILLPVLCCGFSVVATSGLLGIFGWEVSVISSNFISIQLIITMAITIHLMVRYRELKSNSPDMGQRELILETIIAMAKPCLYTVLTTMAGFSSLMLSNNLPVIHFGWMMTAGVAVSLILTFLLFPTVLIQMPKRPMLMPSASRFSLTRGFASFTARRGNQILIFSLIILVLAVIGASRLIVENSFIDYFKKNTEIYQGMKVIDQHLGGTTPLDVVVDLGVDQGVAATAEEFDGDDLFDEFEEEFAKESQKSQYWFTAEKMRRIEDIHDYLDQLPETGKVMSLGTMLKVGKLLNDGESLDSFMLALMYNELPERFKKIILSPYVSVENNQARFSVRIRDSEPNLRRHDLLVKIRSDLTEELGVRDENLHLANMLVLYDNMLQSLFSSQIKTLGAVIFVLLVMFLILFRSLRIALIAIFPNILSVGVVLGFMGWSGIPLDMMTITIAAISVGIAVDNTIHYIHRFKKEFEIDHQYIPAMRRCHGSIGYAMYYTSITVIIGFSILMFSNFIPGVYFGLLTGLAMLIALIAALTLLPQLIIFIKPLGPEGGD